MYRMNRNDMDFILWFCEHMDNDYSVIKYSGRAYGITFNNILFIIEFENEIYTVMKNYNGTLKVRSEYKKIEPSEKHADEKYYDTYLENRISDQRYNILKRETSDTLPFTFKGDIKND